MKFDTAVKNSIVSIWSVETREIYGNTFCCQRIRFLLAVLSKDLGKLHRIPQQNQLIPTVTSRDMFQFSPKTPLTAFFWWISRGKSVNILFLFNVLPPDRTWGFYSFGLKARLPVISTAAKKGDPVALKRKEKNKATLCVKCWQTYSKICYVF